MIQLSIKEEADLYSPYDPTQTRINKEIYAYLKMFCLDIESKKNPPDKLIVFSPEPIDPDRLRNAINYAANNEQEELERQIQVNNKRALWGYFVGLALSIVGYVSSLLMDQVFLELVSFLGTMTFREAVIIHTKVNPDMKSLKHRVAPLIDIELENISSEKSEL